MRHFRDVVFAGAFALLFLAGLFWVVGMFTDPAGAQTYGRPIPTPEPTYSSHIVITLEGDTIPCMMVEHYGAVALDCDWR